MLFLESYLYINEKLNLSTFNTFKVNYSISQWLEGITFSDYFNSELGSFNELLEGNSTNIKWVAKKLVPFNKDRNFYNELIHVGQIGLYEAYKNYNSAKNNGVSVKFWTLAEHRVRGSMKDFISKYSNIIRPSQQVESIWLKIMELNLKDQTPKNIARKLNIKPTSTSSK
jgi:DNA-directed RNA polymerase specialized sigma subunit